MPIRYRNPVMFATGLLWLTLVGLGMRVALDYENTAGASASPPAFWPAASSIVRPPGRFTLVMFAHPNCPCTRASVAELDVLMARGGGKIAAFVRFSKPGAREADIRETALWRKAAAIPGVSVAFDEDDSETTWFGARVSGQAVLYDPEGRLVFSGGITRARGHEGDNPGLDSVMRLVMRLVNGEAAAAQTRVFGCSLRSGDFAWKRQ
jgi:hypothetical protein